MEIRTTSSDGIDSEKRSASPAKVKDVTVVSDGAYDTAVADNGNVIDEGLQRGLKGRHLVSIKPDKIIMIGAQTDL